MAETFELVNGTLRLKETIESDIRNYTAEAKKYATNIKTCETKITNYKNNVAEIELFLAKLEKKKVKLPSILAPSVTDQIPKMLLSIRSNENYIPQYQEQIVKYEKYLAARQTELEKISAKLDEKFIINIPELLARYSDTIESAEVADGELRLLTKQMFTKLNVVHENYEVVNNDLILQPLKICITRNLMIPGSYPVRFRSHKFKFDNGFCENQAVHPHIMSGLVPCWGDFGSMASEAAKNGDVYLLLDVALLFLQQVNGHDTAGARWPKMTFGKYAPSGKKGYVNAALGKAEFASSRPDWMNPDWVEPPPKEPEPVVPPLVIYKTEEDMLLAFAKDGDKL